MPSLSTSRSGVVVRSAYIPNVIPPAYDTMAIASECSAASGTIGMTSTIGAPNAYRRLGEPGTLVMVTLNNRFPYSERARPA